MKSKIFNLLNPIVKKFSSPRKLVIPLPYEDSTISALALAYKHKVIYPTLVGDKNKIKKLITKNIDFKYDLIHEKDEYKAIEKSIELVRNKEFNILMKGMVKTNTLLHIVLNKEKGLKGESILSHVAVFDIPTYKKVLLITDAGVNIQPDFNRKMEIIENSINLAKVLNIKNPKVAILSAVEKVISSIPATIDADLITKVSKQGKFKDATIEGPFALDNAISVSSAKVKGIKSEVAGQADILILPNIESANILYKALTYFARAKVASLVIGASIPLVIPSRTDDKMSKFLSIMLGCVYSEKHEKTN
ncbi:MAG: bifunctional enoyl-CoA hydratase/phosphate acetyltransferase [Candidatus Firestonebacteria bacterium]